jgi:hypothetical protein
VDTLIQEKALLERKLAAVNLVLELEEEQQGDNNVWDSDGDGSQVVVDDYDGDHSDDDIGQVVVDDDDDGDHSDGDESHAVGDDDDGEFWDDDGERKQQRRSLHDNVQSTNPLDNGDSGSHHGNQESNSLHSNRETSIRHDNGEAVSLHSNSGNHHRHQQQAGVQRVHGKTSWDTGMEEEEDDGKDIVEADSTDDSMYGDDGQQQPYDNKGDVDQQQSHHNSNTELQSIIRRTTSASYHSNATSNHPHSYAELHNGHENTALDGHYDNQEADYLNSNAELHSIYYSKGESARLHSNATSANYPSNAMLMSHPSNATSANLHGNQHQQWRHGVPLNLTRRYRDSKLEFGEQHRIQQLLAEEEEIRHGQQWYGVQVKQGDSQSGADPQRIRTVSHGRMENDFKAQSGRSQGHMGKDSEVQSGPFRDHIGVASQPQQQQIQCGADPQQAQQQQNRGGADPQIQSGLVQVGGADPHVTSVHSQMGKDSGVQSGSSKDQVGGDPQVQSEHGGGKVDSAQHVPTRTAAKSNQVAAHSKQPWSSRVLITIDDIANSRRKDYFVDGDNSKAITRSSRVLGRMGTGAQEGPPSSADVHDVDSRGNGSIGDDGGAQWTDPPTEKSAPQQSTSRTLEVWTKSTAMNRMGTVPMSGGGFIPHGEQLSLMMVDRSHFGVKMEQRSQFVGREGSVHRLQLSFRADYMDDPPAGNTHPPCTTTTETWRRTADDPLG